LLAAFLLDPLPPLLLVLILLFIKGTMRTEVPTLLHSSVGSPLIRRKSLEPIALARYGESIQERFGDQKTKAPPVSMTLSSTAKMDLIVMGDVEGGYVAEALREFCKEAELRARNA
jgi:hypothetical protein